MVTYIYFMLPNIDPVALKIGPLAIHWYGLMYLFAFLGSWLLARHRAKQTGDWTPKQVDDIIFYGALGVILGGRIGYVLFYDFANVIHEPLILFKIWQGGMSFHGGLLGVLFALLFYAKYIQKSFLAMTDFVIPFVPLGLGLGRLGNFINGELAGRTTDVPWAMIFPQLDFLPRHPSQLYEFLLEGVVLFVLLWWFSAKPKPKMAVTGLFLFLYGIFRFAIEFFREPDGHLGFIALDWLTMGQLLSIPLIVTGGLFLLSAYKKHEKVTA